jgi:hypothetical protein
MIDRYAALIKIEDEYGVDAVPVPATDAILTDEPKISVLGRTLKRASSKLTMGNIPGLNIGEGLKLTFNSEVKGSGTAGTPPRHGALHRACNMTESIVAVTSVTYKPNSAAGNVDAAESVTIYFYYGGLLFKLLGARGNMTVNLTAKEYGKFGWEFTGIYGGPVDSSIPVCTFDTAVPPRFINAAFTFDSYAAVINALSLDLGNKVAARIDANAPTGIVEYAVMDRAPKGKIDPEIAALATKDFFEHWVNSTESALTAALTGSAGNITTITAPKCQQDNAPTLNKRENVLTHDLTLTLNPNAGDDELVIAYT